MRRDGQIARRTEGRTDGRTERQTDRHYEADIHFSKNFPTRLKATAYICMAKNV
jgi:hypothetical protein